MTPDVYLAYLDAVGRRDGAALRDLLETDAVVEFPYAPADAPWARLEGIDAIAAYFGGLELFGDFTFTALRAWVLQAGEPGEWLAEFHGSSTVTTTGAAYEQDYIVRFRIGSDGRLAFVREYWDPTRVTS